MCSKKEKRYCYGFDEDEMFMLYKRACSRKNLKVHYKYYDFVMWNNLRKKVEEWYPKIEESEKENVKHYLIGKARFHAQELEKLKTITIVVVSALMSLLITALTFGIDYYQDVFDAKMTELRSERINCIWITESDYSSLDKEVIESLLNHNCTFKYEDVENPQVFFDKDIESSSDYRALRKILETEGFKICSTDELDLIVQDAKSTFWARLFIGFIVSVIVYAFCAIIAWSYCYDRNTIRLHFYDDIKQLIGCNFDKQERLI